MSMINNSYEYYQSSQGLLSMLNSKKSGNALIDQIISNNDLKFQRKMESMGFSSNSSNSKYKNVDKAATNLLDALSKLDDKSLYEAESGKEYDNAELLKGVTNFVTAYNSTVTNLTSCGGTLYSTFQSEFLEAYKAKAEDFANIGITMSSDNKLVIDQEKLAAANPEDIKALLGSTSSYYKNIASTVDSIDTIVNKALALSSGTYSSSGLML